MDVLSFFSPCKSHFEVEVKEAPPSKKRGRFHWSDYLDKKLIEEIKTQGISSYPFYLRKINGLSKWRLLSLHTEFGFSPKQLKDRFYESISDKLDKSNFSEEEDACILEEVSKYKESSSIKWGEISVELFKRFSGPGGLYRSSLQIKNQYHLLKTSLLKPKSAPVEKKVRLTEISSERVDC
jgi:AraC-like DNA-binding protein